MVGLDSVFSLASRSSHQALIEQRRNASLPLGLAERKTCPIDGRGQYVVITQGGRNLQKKMWDTYSAAIERHVGAKLSNKDAAQLCDLLGRLA